MTILFLGSTAAELGGNVYTGSKLDALYTSEGASHNRDNAFQWTFFRSPATTIVWTHFDLGYPAFVNDGRSDGFFLTWYDDLNRAIARLDIDNGDIYMRAYGGSQVTTLLTGTTNNQRNTFDIKIERDPGGVGLKVDFYINQALIGTATTTAGSALLPTKITANNADCTGSGSTDPNIWSQVIVRDGFSTLGLKLARLIPDADATYTDWSEGFAAVQSFDGVLSSGTTGDQESFTFSNYNGPTPTSVLSVAMLTYALPPESGANTINSFVRIGGVDYAGDDVTITEPQVTFHEYLNNPATAAPWTIAAIDALEAGVEAKVI